VGEGLGDGENKMSEIAKLALALAEDRDKYKALAEELAEALQGLVDNAWTSCEEENGELVGRATQEEWDAYCEAMDAVCAALAKYEQEKGV